MLQTAGALQRPVRRQSDCDPISYEDILIARYLDELKKSQPHTRADVPTVEKSPYSQRLGHTHVVPMHRGIASRPPRQTLSAVPCNGFSRPTSTNPRPASAVSDSSGECIISTTTGRKYRPIGSANGAHRSGFDNGSTDGRVKQKIDANYMDDSDQWENSSPPPFDDNRHKLRNRPFSAPAHKRPASSMYGSGPSRPTSAKSVSYTRKVRSLYRQKVQRVTVTAFKNGTREGFMRITAPNIRLLLEACTEKLGLTSAARRVYLEDGTEVTDECQLRAEGGIEVEVYISSGEPFRSPFKDAKQTMAMQNAQWTMNGLVTQNIRSKPPRAKMSKRFRSLLEKSRKRVLVFANGNGSRSVEVVADPEKLDDLIELSTSKLDIGGRGCRLYDWDGNVISWLDEAPVLDRCLQTWNNPVVGPLWLSKGEGFSPKGVKEFLVGLISSTRTKLKDARKYRKQLQFAQNEETHPKVELVTLLSMSDKEIEDALDVVNKEMEDYSNALNRLQQQLDKLSDRIAAEENERCEYTMKHIKPVDMDNKLVGKKGIRLKVYENGSCDDATVFYFNLQQAQRGVTQPNELMERFLEQCATVSSLAYPRKNLSIRPVPKRVYDKNGHELMSLHDLEYDQEIWLSFGEPWKNPFTYTLGMQCDKVHAIDVEDSNKHVSRHAVKEPLMTEDTKALDGKVQKWELVKGLPEGVVTRVINDRSTADDKETVQTLLTTAEIDANSWFLQYKEKPDLVLSCEPVVDVKIRKSASDGWPTEPQIWVISKNGFIHSKTSPLLVLAVTDDRFSSNLHPSIPNVVKVEGKVIQLQRKSQTATDTRQQWTFTADGYIVNQAYSDLVLTCLGSKYGNEATLVSNEGGSENKSGVRHFVAACARLNEQRKSQRWAIKQERFDNLGQWKHTDAENAEWHKQAFSWPIKRDGTLNEDYDWPMEGYLLPHAPPLKSHGTDKSNKDCAKRLQVLKNGVKDLNKAVGVVAPDLTSMKSKNNHYHGDKKAKGSVHHVHRGGSRSAGHQGKSKVTTDSVVAETESITDTAVHCDPEQSIYKIEFTMFLDKCTSQLDLPFPARRLFDENGVEHFNLSHFSRDQYVYVTCGEPWSDPRLNRAEQQRRYLMANLASDLTQIRQFIDMRDPQDLVLQVESSLSAGSSVIIGQSALSDRDGSSVADKGEKDRDENLNASVDQLFSKNLSAHDLAHSKNDDRNGRRWPWEKLVNSGMDESLDTTTTAGKQNDRQSMRESYTSRPRSHRSSSQDRSNKLQLQRFICEDGGYIAVEADRSLVLGLANESDGGAGTPGAVALTKRRPDDIMQRWVIKENGLIQTKHDPRIVLAVTLNKGNRTTAEADALSYVGCNVSLQRKKTVQFGRANQRWRYDAASGLIYAFASNTTDKEITAANKFNVCTYAVLGKQETDQTGYMVEMPGEKGVAWKDKQKILVCSSCARAMRGRYKLKKLDSSIDFYCAMGCAKEYGLQPVGSFRCLNGKVDLSTHEAVPTMEAWEQRYFELKEELSVRTVAKQISAASSPYTVKVLAFKNGGAGVEESGKGHGKKGGELIVGSSITGILRQATERLQLSQAARRLYTTDGTLIMNLDDLVDWAKENAPANDDRGAVRKREPEDSTSNAERRGSSSATDSEGERLDQAVPQKAITEHIIGYPAVGNRQYIDEETSCIVIPNPREAFPADGMLVSWQLYAKHSGMIALDVFRPVLGSNGSMEPGRFTLVGQSVCELTEGELMIDISGKPIPVKRGDVIGFHVIEKALLPYDVVKRDPLPFHYLMTEKNPPINQPLKMETSQEEGIRTYSLMAKIISEVESPPKNSAKDSSVTKKQKSSSEKDRKMSETSGKGVEPAHKSRRGPIRDGLRYPIQVFVSSGEEFIKPGKGQELLDTDYESRSRVAGVNYELSKEKHILRQMRGRRIDEHAPATLNSNLNPDKPVVVEGGWQEPTADEIQKREMIQYLQTQLQKMKSNEKKQKGGGNKFNTDTTRRLYPQPKTTRMLIFPNGGKLESAQYVWGGTLAETLDNCTTRLGLSTPARYLFAIDGQLVEDFDSIERDQVLCASSTRRFSPPQESQQMIEIKANWGRMNRTYGPQSTNIVVETRKSYNFDNGFIRSRSTPELVLSITERKVSGRPGHPAIGEADVSVDGFEVTLQPKSKRPAQQWTFTSDGYVCNKERSDLVLTYLSSSASSGTETQGERLPGAEEGYCIAACKRLDLDFNPYQRGGSFMGGDDE